MKGKENYPEQLAKMGFENFRVEQVGSERPEVGDIHSGKTLRHLAHEAVDKANDSTNILDTDSGKLFTQNTGYIRYQGDKEGKALTLEAIDQMVKHTPRGRKRKSRKRKTRKRHKSRRRKRRKKKTKKRGKSKRKARSTRRK